MVTVTDCKTRKSAMATSLREMAVAPRIADIVDRPDGLLYASPVDGGLFGDRSEVAGR